MAPSKKSNKTSKQQNKSEADSAVGLWVSILKTCK